MRSRWIQALAITVAVVVLLTSHQVHLAAQQETPTPASGAGTVPEGVVVEPLGRQELGQLQPGPAFIGLARLIFEPDAAAPVETATGPTLFFVESGMVTFEVDGGTTVVQATPSGSGASVGAGSQLLIPVGAIFSSRNDGPAPAAVLRVAISSVAPGPVVAPGVTFQRLASAVAEALPSPPAWIALSRVTLTPGARTVTRARQEDGPDLLFVEVGRATIGVPGAEMTLSPGNTAVIQPKTESVIRNGTISPLVLLVLALSSEPIETSVATPATGTPEA